MAAGAEAGRGDDADAVGPRRHGFDALHGRVERHGGRRVEGHGGVLGDGDVRVADQRGREAVGMSGHQVAGHCVAVGGHGHGDGASFLMDAADDVELGEVVEVDDGEEHERCHLGVRRLSSSAVAVTAPE